MKHAVWTSATLLCCAGVRADVITYRWTGTVLENDGVTPLLAGAAVGGLIQWDTSAPLVASNEWFARYTSPNNVFTLTCGDLTFTAGSAALGVTSMALGASSNGISLTGGDTSVPDGWSIDHTSEGDAYGMIIQGAPVTTLGPPTALHASDWPLKIVRLDFMDGVSFPGGDLAGRHTVETSIDTLEPVPAPWTAVPVALTLAPRRRRS